MKHPRRHLFLMKDNASHTLSAAMLRINHMENYDLTERTVDLGTFIQYFEDVPRLSSITKQEAKQILKSIKNILSDTKEEWRKRLEALKRIRSLILAGATSYDDFYMLIKPLERPLQGALEDLHSAVVREACISIGFVALNLGSLFDKSSNFLLPTLLNLQQSPVEVIASTGRIALYLIIQTSTNQHMISLFSYYSVSSRSKKIRSCCFELLEYILKHRPILYSPRHIELLEEVLKRGISDASENARFFSRKAFEGFEIHFPARAKKLVQSLDLSCRKTLLGTTCVSTRTSQNTLKNAGSTLSTETYASRRWAFITNSVIDEKAAQRAKARTEYAQWSRNKIKMISSTAVARKNGPDPAIPHPQERPSLSRYRTSELRKKSRDREIFEAVVQQLAEIAPDFQFSRIFPDYS